MADSAAESAAMRPPGGGRACPEMCQVEEHPEIGFAQGQLDFELARNLASTSSFTRCLGARCLTASSGSAYQEPARGGRGWRSPKSGEADRSTENKKNQPVHESGRAITALRHRRLVRHGASVIIELPVSNRFRSGFGAPTAVAYDVHKHKPDPWFASKQRRMNGDFGVESRHIVSMSSEPLTLQEKLAAEYHARWEAWRP